MLKRTVIAGVLGACLMPATAAAQTVSPEGQRILDALGPDARDYVMSRMGPDQTVRGLVETTLLNRLEQQYVAVDYMRYVPAEEIWVVVVATPEGGRQAYHVDYTMLDQFYDG
jgi:hypothetical protein